ISLLRLLAVIERPLTTELVSRVIGTDVTARIDNLVRRGLLEQSASGSRVHAVARSAVIEVAPPDSLDALRKRAAIVLADVEDPTLCVEAIRLRLQTGDRAE